MNNILELDLDIVKINCNDKKKHNCVYSGQYQVYCNCIFTGMLPFLELDPAIVKDMVTVNITAATYLCHQVDIKLKRQ